MEKPTPEEIEIAKKREHINRVYKTDASQIEGTAIDVRLPETIQELKSIIKINTNIVPRGGGTGLAGGAVPQNSVVIDLSKLNNISNLDVKRKTIDVEAGVILDDLNLYLDNYELEFPVNPSSHEICTMGGMIATNAVGSRAIRYGKTSNWIEALEIVDSKGETQKLSKAEFSDFTGLEGITGIIVKAKLKLISKKTRTATLFGRKTLKEILEIAKQMKTNPNVSMVEFMNEDISEMIGLNRNYTLIVEFESSEGKLKGDEYKELLDLRDKIYPLLAEKGFSRIEDPKVVFDKIQTLMEWLEKKKIPYFGHLGVGILHPCFNPYQEELIPEMMKLVRKLHGQISGEHGIGLIKRQFLDFSEKKLIRSIKRRCDPENKFNQNKILSTKSLNESED
jgi:FAD/FMN-containing dehydrogenase